VFLTETLAELAEHRPLRILLGDPVTELAGTPLAVTFAPVPGFQRRAARLGVYAPRVSDFESYGSPARGTATSMTSIAAVVTSATRCDSDEGAVIMNRWRPSGPPSLSA
jgi:hypothetical protein